MALTIISSSWTLINIKLSEAHVHQHLKEPQRRSCPNQDKKQQSIGTNFFYLNTSYGFEYKKSASVDCLLKYS